MIGNYLSCIGNGIKKMFKKTEKLLKQEISELTERVNELESIVVAPQPESECDSSPKSEAKSAVTAKELLKKMKLNVNFTEVVAALLEGKIVARAKWFKEIAASGLEIKNENFNIEPLIMRVYEEDDDGKKISSFYHITKSDMMDTEWIIFDDYDSLKEWSKKVKSGDDKDENPEPEIEFCLNFEDVIGAIREEKLAARAGWLNDKRPKKILQILRSKYESVVTNVGESFNQIYGISEDDLNAKDWVVFKNEKVYNESVDKKRKRPKGFQIDVKTGRG